MSAAARRPSPTRQAGQSGQPSAAKYSAARAAWWRLEMLPLTASVCVLSARSWRRGSRRFVPWLPAVLRLWACHETRAFTDSSQICVLEFSVMLYLLVFFGKVSRDAGIIEKELVRRGRWPTLVDLESAQVDGERE